MSFQLRTICVCEDALEGGEYVALMIVICDCFVMAVNCIWTKRWNHFSMWSTRFVTQDLTFSFFSRYLAFFFLSFFTLYVCVCCALDPMLSCLHSCRWSATWVVRMHEVLDQTLSTGKTIHHHPMYQASLRLQSTVGNCALAPKVEKPTAPFLYGMVNVCMCEQPILARSKRIHWNIILFVKCFT